MRFLGIVLLVALLTNSALAEPAPGVSSSPLPSVSPSSPPPASPRPSPSASPVLRAGWSNELDGFGSLVDQAAHGSGIQPPEGPGFSAGNPLSPLTPYDTFASTPNTPGVAGLAQFILTTRYAGSRMGASLQSGFGYAAGSTTNNAYWTEPLMPTLNPHLGSQALPYAVTFPIHAGQDDGTDARGSILEGSVGTNDGSWLLRGGWFSLNQSDRFVFAQPPLTSVTPALTIQPAESLGDGAPALDGWHESGAGSPLQGIDLTAREKSATLEITNAALPSLPGTSARLTLGSVVLARGDDTRLSADVLHLATSGNIVSSTTLYGQQATLHPGPQGELPTSDLGGQTQTIAGVRGSFDLGSFATLVEVGRSWYDASDVLLPGTSQPGGFYHVGLTRVFGHSTYAVEAFRFEPRYATAFLPYGAPENIWSVAWSWPGVWLKSTYQLVDNTVSGANRQGYRLGYGLSGSRLEARAAFSSFQQLDASTTDNANQTGFVEGFFLPQSPGNGTLGRTHQYAAWLGWHPKIADVTLDYVDDTMHRDFVNGQLQDAVSLNTPQAVIAASRLVGATTLLAAGYGRFAQRGSWAQGSLTNVDFAQDVTFIGAQMTESKHALVLVQLRDTVFSGLPSMLAGPSPNYRATTLIVEQRFHV